jgi:hypothetical protein
VLITNHVLAGALVGLASPGPAAAFGLGVVSHFVMDAVPHWGDVGPDEFLPYAVSDGLVGLGVLTYVAALTRPSRRARVVAGMLGACFPDSDKPAELFFGRSPFPAVVDAFHRSVQRESSRRMPQEVVVALTGLAVVRRLVGRG